MGFLVGQKTQRIYCMAEMTYASNGKGNLGVTLGAIGTGLGVLGNGILNGGLFNLGARNDGGYPTINGCKPCCSDDELVTRYDAGKDAKIANLEMKNALLEANAFTDKKSLEMYTYFDTWRRQHEAEQNAMFTQQAVYNATNTANIGCMQKQIEQLYGMTKLVIPATSVCPQPMPLHNSWAAPTAGAST